MKNLMYKWKTNQNVLNAHRIAAQAALQNCASRPQCQCSEHFGVSVPPSACAGREAIVRVKMVRLWITWINQTEVIHRWKDRPAMF